MSFTHETTDRHLRVLLRRHPHLAGAKVEGLLDAGLTPGDISLFIEENWRGAYGNEARIRFSPSMVTEILGAQTMPSAGLGIWRSGELVTVLLGARVGLHSPEQEPLWAQLVTGLTTKESLRGQGYSQLAVLRQIKYQIDEGCRFGLGWFDASRAGLGSSFRTLTQQARLAEATIRVIVWARLLREQEATWHASLGRRELLKARVYGSLRKPVAALPTIEAASGCIGECVEFLNDWATGHRLSRSWTADDVGRLLALNDADMAGAGWALRRQGRIIAALIGYRNPLAKEGHFFSIDVLAFDAVMTNAERTAFLCAAEDHLVGGLGCCMVLAPGNACPSGIWRHGYFPIDAHALSCSSYHPDFAVTPADLRGICLGLR